MTDLLGETPADILSHHADPDAVDSFIKWRKAVRKPLTDRAARMIAKTLTEIWRDGGDPTEALDLAQEHGWQTIKAHWYWRLKQDEQRANAANAIPSNGAYGGNGRIGSGEAAAFAAVAARMSAGEG